MFSIPVEPVGAELSFDELLFSRIVRFLAGFEIEFFTIIVVDE